MNAFTRFFTRPLALAVVGLGLMLGATGCASVPRVGVTSDFDHAVNFRAYKTWAWYPEQPADAEGGPAKGYNSFFDKRMRASIEREMTNKGLTRDDQNPDIFVAYSARVENQQQANPGAFGPYGYPYMYGYGYGWNRPYVTNYKAGNIIIDFVDAQRKELVWRGYGQAAVNSQTITEPDVMRIVSGVMGAYPPGPSTARR